MKTLWQIVILISCVAVFGILPALLSWYLGHIPQVEWYHNSEETLCTIDTTYVQQDTCYRTCSCTTIGKVTTCQTCPYTCYKGHITVHHTLEENQYFEDITAIDGQTSKSNVQHELNESYAIGTTISCWYSLDDYSDIRLKQPDVDSFEILSYVFFGLSGLAIIVYIIFKIIFNTCC